MHLVHPAGTYILLDRRSTAGKPFFFSSRRRHTRWPRDWSSDVCSSDLPLKTMLSRRAVRPLAAPCSQPHAVEIGRASCRERVYSSLVAIRVKKKYVTVDPSCSATFSRVDTKYDRIEAVMVIGVV